MSPLDNKKTSLNRGRKYSSLKFDKFQLLVVRSLLQIYRVSCTNRLDKCQWRASCAHLMSNRLNGSHAGRAPHSSECLSCYYNTHRIKAEPLVGRALRVISGQCAQSPGLRRSPRPPQWWGRRRRRVSVGDDGQSLPQRHPPAHCQHCNQHRVLTYSKYPDLHFRSWLADFWNVVFFCFDLWLL